MRRLILWLFPPKPIPPGLMNLMLGMMEPAPGGMSIRNQQRYRAGWS